MLEKLMNGMSRPPQPIRPFSFLGRIRSNSRKVWFCASLLGLLGVHEIPTTAMAFQVPNPPSDLRTAYQAYMLNGAWKDFARLPPGVEVNDHGLVGLNKDGMLYPELQTSGSAFVVRGVLQGRTDWREKGWRILDAAFIGMSPEGRLIGKTDLVHSSSFFLSGYSEALLADPPAATPERVKQFLSAVSYLTSGKPHEEGRAMCRRFTHRCFLWALMYEGAEAVGPGLGHEMAARQFTAIGLADQKQGGVLPENYGFDALYQSIANDAIIKVTAIERDPELRGRLAQAARASLDMMAARVDDRGRLDTTGSVRMTREKMRDGHAKRISHWQIAFPFVGAAILFQEPTYLSVANRVMKCDVSCQNEE